MVKKEKRRIQEKLMTMSIDDLLSSCIVPLGFTDEIKEELKDPNSQLTIANLKSRSESEVINLRRFHNYVKHLILEKAIRIRERDGYNGPISLLDVSAGKGGDIGKWGRLGIMNVYGMDIDVGSITEANRRLKEYFTKTPVVE